MPPRKHQGKPVYQIKATFADDEPQQPQYRPKTQGANVGQPPAPANHRSNNRMSGSQYGGGQPGPQIPAISPQVQDQMMMIMPHLDNIQQMEKSQLDGLLMSLLQMVGPDIAG